MNVKSLFLILFILFSFSKQSQAQQCWKEGDELLKFNINVEGYLNPIIQVMTPSGELIDLRTSEISLFGMSLFYRLKGGNLAFEAGFGSSFHTGLWNGHEYGQTSDGESISATHKVSGPLTGTAKFNVLVKLNPNPNYKRGKRKKAKYFVLGLERLIHYGSGEEALEIDLNGTSTLSNDALGLWRFKLGFNIGEIDKVNYGFLLNYRTVDQSVLTDVSGLGASVFCRIPLFNN